MSKVPSAETTEIRMSAAATEERAPRVTIGLPVFNEEAYIRRAMDSLLAQEFEDYELIVSDNASTDGTYAICQEYAARDRRIRVCRNATNVGAVANFQAVVREARGKYFMWAAADDLWAPQFLGTLLHALETHKLTGVAMCGTRREHENGDLLDIVRFQGPSDPTGRSPGHVLMCLTSSRKFNLFIYGLFYTPLLKGAISSFANVLGGDRIFLCQFALATRFHYVDEVLYTRTHRREHHDAYLAESRRGGTPWRQVLALAKVIITSPVIPRRRKLRYLPMALWRYSLMTLGKTYGSSMVWSLISGYLNADELMTPLTRWALAAPVAINLLLIPIAHRWAGLPGVLLALVGLNLFLGIGLLLRLMLLALRRLSSLHTDFSDSQSAIKDELARSMPLLDRELRYLTDAVVTAGGPRPKGWTGNPIADFAQERHARQENVIAFARLVEESRIRELYLSQIFPGIDRVSVPVGAVYELTGHANKVDMLYVCAIARHRGARKIFEFGTYHGRTSYHLTFACDEGAQVTTVNLPPEADPRYGPYIGRYFRGTEREKLITQVYCDSRKFDSSRHKQEYDLIFVDGDHSYEMVQNDTLKAFEMLKPGGVILWHDYGVKSLDLVRFFRDFTKERPLFRLKRTCVLLYIDNVDPLTFEPHPLPEGLEKDFLESTPFFIEELYHG